MCRLIETICVRDGQILHLSDHQDRMERSIFHLFGSHSPPLLEEYLEVPLEFNTGWVKCRVLYDQAIREITWNAYQIRSISSIGLVYNDAVNYSWKFEDRSVFDQAIRAARTDDVIMIRDGYLTDASYANIILKSGSDWITPSTPLLPGTQRKRLLESRAIQAEPIRVRDLVHFEGIKYINAMLDIERSPEMPMETIRHIQ